MNDSTLNEVTDTLSKTSVSNDGVSFKGKSLVLNTQKDCDEVVEAINSCKNMQYLNLEGNTLGVEASKAISKALESKKELKRALWMDMFTGRVKEEIPRALEYLGKGLTIAGAQLTELDLSDNAFGPIGVEGLAGLLGSKACYQLQVLKLNNNGLGIYGGQMLADALLTCHRNSTKEGKSLALKLFVAGRNRLENKGAAELAKVFQTLGTLEEIRMPQNGIYHKGIKALSDSFKKNPNLKVLDLNDNTITKKGAKHIASALPHLQQLKVLNLGDCLLRTGGATVLANALADGHTNLEELHLGCNDIKSDGGLAVVKAMTNKNKLKELNLNGNMFGSDGRQLLKDALVRNQKLYSLGGLSDDESCDEDERDETSDEENEESEDENAKSEPETNGYNPVKEINVNGTEFNFSESKTTLNDPSTILNNLVENLSIKAKPVGSLATFLDSPTVENFTQVKADKIYEFININKDSSVDFYVETFIPMLAKISSLSCCNNKEVVKLSSEISKTMYKDLFAWASEKNQLSTVNNVLFVHLGLIKSEDKKFKINWDIKGSLSALKTATSEGKVPTATQDTLKCFMDRETSKQICEEIIVG